MWLLSIILVCTTLGSLEAVFRWAGHKPSVVDDAALWSLQRDQVYDCDGKTPVVLLGASRIQMGFALDELERRYPRYRAVQLATTAWFPWASFRDLALDEKFDGIVICSLVEEGFRRERWDDQIPYIEYYHDHFNINAALNARISSYLQNKLTLLYPELRVDEVLLHLLKYRSLPPPIYYRMFPDRSRPAGYFGRNMAEHRSMRVEMVREYYADRPPVLPGHWVRDVMEIEPYVGKIQGRGGKVVFVRYPSTGECWAYEEKTCPKAQCWDVFARQTSATTIHFRDFPELAGFDCPDTSHLDYRDAIAFTRALLKILEERHIIEPP